MSPGWHCGHSLSAERDRDYSLATIDGHHAIISFAYGLRRVRQVEVAVGRGFNSIPAAAFGDSERAAADADREGELSRAGVLES